MFKKYFCLIFFFLTNNFLFAQVALPEVSQPFLFQRYDNQSFHYRRDNNIGTVNPIVNIDLQRQQIQHQQIINEVEQHERKRLETINQIKKEIEEFYSERKNSKYDFPSLSNVTGTKYYYDVFEKMLKLDSLNFSTKEVNFDIENAYFENKMSKEEFNQTIKRTGEFLIAKMKELGYDLNSNSAKNYMLFQYFSETLEVKGFKTKHFPLKYDFEDYRGAKNWSKMFVTKLLKTGTGQCHSMPLLYLTLAEEINAEAFLSLAPEHSYIKFQDEISKKVYSIELTNGMFSTPSFILNSGYIKAEALQNRMYMQNLSKQELLGYLYADLANGYIHKFGYDGFVEQVVYKALELDPKNVFAQMIKSNYDTKHFEYACSKVGINPRNKEELQRIKNYPEIIQLLMKVNHQYKTIDDLGYEAMPAEVYERWLKSVNQEKNKQEDEKMKEQLKKMSRAFSNYKNSLEKKD